MAAFLLSATFVTKSRIFPGQLHSARTSGTPKPGEHKTNFSNLTFPETTETTMCHLRLKGTHSLHGYFTSAAHANNSGKHFHFCNYSACTLSINSHTQHKHTHPSNRFFFPSDHTGQIVTKPTANLREQPRNH